MGPVEAMPPLFSSWGSCEATARRASSGVAAPAHSGIRLLADTKGCCLWVSMFQSYQVPSASFQRKVFMSWRRFSAWARQWPDG